MKKVELVSTALMMDLPIEAIYVRVFENNFSIFGTTMQSINDSMFRLALNSVVVDGRRLCRAKFFTKDEGDRRYNQLRFLKLFKLLTEQNYHPQIQYATIDETTINTLSNPTTACLCKLGLTDGTFNSLIRDGYAAEAIDKVFLYSEDEDTSTTEDKCLPCHTETPPQSSPVEEKENELHSDTKEDLYPELDDVSKEGLIVRFTMHYLGSYVDRVLHARTSTVVTTHMKYYDILTAYKAQGALSYDDLLGICGSKASLVQVLRRLTQANVLIPEGDKYKVASHICYACNKSFEAWVASSGLYHTVVSMMCIALKNKAYHFNILGAKMSHGADGEQAIKWMLKYTVVFRDQLSKNNFDLNDAFIPDEE